MDDPRAGTTPAEGLDKCELTEGVQTRSAFHGVSQWVLGALKITQVQHEVFRSWGSYQLVAVISHPVLQAELPSRAVTVIMGITASGALGKGRGLQLKTGALTAGYRMVRNISWKLLCCSDFPVAWSVLARLLSLVEGVFLCNKIHLLTLAGLGANTYHFPSRKSGIQHSVSAFGRKMRASFQHCQKSDINWNKAWNEMCVWLDLGAALQNEI